jgi:hypothetical protein
LTGRLQKLAVQATPPPAAPAPPADMQPPRR